MGGKKWGKNPTNTRFKLLFVKLTGKGESFIELGDDVYGNLTRIENKLAKIPDEKEMEKRLQVLTEELGVDDSNMLIDTAPEEEDAPEKDPQDRE